MLLSRVVAKLLKRPKLQADFLSILLQEKGVNSFLIISKVVMKFLNISWCVLSLLCVNVLTCSADKADSAKLENIQTMIRGINLSTHLALQELKVRYPNRRAPDAVGLYRYFEEVVLPLKSEINKGLALRLKHEWMSTEDAELEKLLQSSSHHPQPVPLSTVYEQDHQALEAYKKSIQDRHPNLCETCPKSFWHRKPRCHRLYELAALCTRADGHIAKSIDIGLKYPEAFSKLKELLPVVQAVDKKQAEVEKKTD